MLVLIGYLGCDIVLVLVVWFVAVTLITAAYAGAMANIVDIAPNFAGKWLIKYCERYLLNYLLLCGSLLLGPILAFAQTIHMSASFLSPIVAGLLTQESVSKNFIIFYSIELYSSFIRISFPFDRYLSFLINFSFSPHYELDVQCSYSKVTRKFNSQQALDAWRQVFGVTACVACATYIVYQIFGTGDVQPWNYPDQKYPQSVQEDSQPLNESPQKNGKIVTSLSNMSEEA